LGFVLRLALMGLTLGYSLCPDAERGLRSEVGDGWPVGAVGLAEGVPGDGLMPAMSASAEMMTHLVSWVKNSAVDRPSGVTW
jgi:hypothetical protein